MEWLWPLFEPYVRKRFERRGIDDPDMSDLDTAFMRLLGSATVTILVQEPWRGSVRFKGLDRLPAAECMDLFRDPGGISVRTLRGREVQTQFPRGMEFRSYPELQTRRRTEVDGFA